MTRFYIVGESVGLIATAETQTEAEDKAVRAAVNAARTVYVHDRLTELSATWMPGRVVG